LKLLLSLVLLITVSFHNSFAQNLFGNNTVSSVKITLPSDTLSEILTDIYSDIYRHADFIFESNGTSDTIKNVGFRLRGNTSREAEKKSFRISFNEFSSGRTYQGVKKLNLNGQHNDPTLIREKLFYDIWNEAGMPERRASFTNLYINGKYYGIYTNMEEMDKDWLKRVFANDKGNLYKCTYPADLAYISANQADYKKIMSGNDRAYDLKTNTTTDDYSDLINLMALLKNTQQSFWKDSIAKWINIPVLLKAYALEVAAGHWDNYAYNKNNYYLYHNPNDGKFWFISYDADNSLGVDWVGRDWATRDVMDWFTKSQARPLIQNILAVNEWKSLYANYLDTIIHTQYDTSKVFAHIDALRNLIAPFVPADTYREKDYGYTTTDFHDGFIKTIDTHTPYGIKPFIAKRTAMAKTQNPTKISSLKNVALNTITIYPNPTSGKIHIISSLQKIDKIEIFSLSGVLLFEDKINFEELDISILENGIYYLTLSSNNTKTNHKLIIQK
jgi:spore coat protein H